MTHTKLSKEEIRLKEDEKERIHISSYFKYTQNGELSSLKEAFTYGGNLTTTYYTGLCHGDNKNERKVMTRIFEDYDNNQFLSEYFGENGELLF